MEEHEYQGLIPDVTAILGTAGTTRQIRGLGGHELRPVSSAVVIGLGGSGIQCVSRIRSAVMADRIDQHAREAIAFLGIDAVDDKGQKPPLPPGVDLGADYINLQGFNPAAYLKGQKPNDPFLQSWWDDRYKVPNGPMNEGLKRERMLGRLCFHKDSATIRTRISQAMTSAARVRSEYVAEGDPGDVGSEIPVYLVSSCAGGTGSSGFLEVVLAIHAAAKGLALKPKIRAFILLPGVFANEVLRQQLGETAAQAQRANAYGFFKELDHFLVKSSELPPMMGMKEIEIEDGELIHQVYLFDSNLGSSGVLAKVTDIYEIVSESIYQFLFSAMGRALIGVDGVNVERILTELDAFKKPRRYCSLGLGRVVFPGDTYRNHLIMWWCDWMVRQGFLRNPTTTELTSLRDSERVTRLVDSIDTLLGRAVSGQFDDDVRSFLDRGREAPRALEIRHDVASAEELFVELQKRASEVSTAVRRELETMRPRLVNELEDLIENSVFVDGASVPIAREIVKHVEKGARSRLSNATDALNAQIAMKESSYQRVEERLEALAEATSRNVLEKAVATVVSVFSDETLTVPESAELVGNAIKDWTQAVHGSELAQARHDFLAQACRRVEQLRLEMERAHERLVTLAGLAKSQWERDDLLGKDAGPEATSVLVPEDSQPEIEWSALSKSTRRAIAEEHATRLSGDLLREFLDRWIAESLTRGFFDFGSDDRVAAMRAESSLLASLERDAIRFALGALDDDGEPVSRLPVDLLDAARQLGEEQRLRTAVDGLERLSRNVCWSWEPGNFHLPPGDNERRVDLLPRVTTGVAAHSSMSELVNAAFPQQATRAQFPDAERVIALSCEWGVPVHCLPVVASWRTDYDLFAARRKRQREENESIEPPSHVDKRFEEFADLVPEYFRPEEAAPRFAQAIVIASALVAQPTKSTTIACFVRDATLPPVSPVRQVRGEGFVGRVVVLDQGQLRPTPSTNDRGLGVLWHEAIRSVGLDVSLSNAIDLAWKRVIQDVEPSDLIGLIDILLDEKVERGLNKRQLPPKERQAFAYLKNALEDLRDQLAEY